MSLVPKDIALAYGASWLRLEKDDAIFREGDEANFYYQVDEGAVKMVTYSDDGNEFIQGIFYSGESFGEPPLFCGFEYPSSAYALRHSMVMRIPKDRFFDLLKDHFQIHVRIDQILCERLRYKNMILSEISFYDPEHRILSLLGYLKSKAKPKSDFLVPLTRQQLADMSGMRVETVIRTIKKMEEAGKLRLQDHKIFF